MVLDGGCRPGVIDATLACFTPTSLPLTSHFHQQHWARLGLANSAHKLSDASQGLCAGHDTLGTNTAMGGVSDGLSRSVGITHRADLTHLGTGISLGIPREPGAVMTPAPACEPNDGGDRSAVRAGAA
jgi:hypothetical protein